MATECPMHSDIQRALDRIQDWKEGDEGAAKRIVDVENEIIAFKLSRFVTEDTLKKALADFKTELLKAMKGKYYAAKALAPWFATSCITIVAIIELFRKG